MAIALRNLCDAVFAGGGVKGIGFIGALEELEKNGYKFQCVTGVSAGAIVASLVAAGYRSYELRDLLYAFDFSKLKDPTVLDYGGIFGKAINAGARYGVYKTDYFLNWLTELLAQKGKRVFRDLRTGETDEKYRYKFQATATDVTDQTTLVLPRDIARFGIDPDTYPIAEAVRLSMSLPLFFMPTRLKDVKGREHIICDGGLLCNYPVDLLDDGTPNPPWPTIGFNFLKASEERKESVGNIIDYGKTLVSIWLESEEDHHISVSNGDFARTILVPTIIQRNGKPKKIKTADFDIRLDEKMALYANGQMAARKFLETWDFESWRQTYRR